MTEELRIKLSVDTSALKDAQNQVRSSLNNIKPAKIFSSSEKANVKSIDNAMIDLQGTMESIKHLDFARLFHNIWDSFKGGQKARNDLKAMRLELKRYQAQLHMMKKTMKEVKFGFKVNPEFGNDEAVKMFMSQWEDLAKKIESGNKIIKLQWLKILKASLVGIISVIGATIAAFGLLFHNAMRTGLAMAQMAHNARKIGMSLDSYQKWGYILEQVGGEAEDLTDFIKTLSDEQVKAREGNEDTIKSFEKIGIAAEKLQTMNQQELFQETVQGLQRVQDEVERTALTYKIFGEEDAAKLSNVLRLNNAELAALAHNYEMLGGYATQGLIDSSNELAASTRNLNVAWQGVKNVLAEAVLPAVNAVVGALVRAMAVVRLFFATIFNIDLTKAPSGAAKASQNMKSYGASMDGAAASAAKLKKQLMGFDELNVVSKPDAGGAGGGDISVGGGGFEMPPMDDIYPSTEDLGLDAIYEWFEQHKRQIEDITVLVEILSGVVMTIVGVVTGNIPLALGGIATTILGIITGLGEDGTWARIWEVIKTGALACWEYVKGVFTPVYQWVMDNVFTPIGNFLSTVGSWIYNNVIAPVINFFKPIFDAAVEMCVNIYRKAKEIIDGIIKAIVSIVTKIKEIFFKIVEIFKALGKACYDYIIKPVFDWIAQAANWVYQKAILPVANFFKWLGGLAYDYIIKPIIDGVIWLRDKVVAIFNYIGTTISDFIGGAIKGVVNGVLYRIESTINGFIRMLNGAVGIINKIPGVNISYIGELSIPRLATGGIATRSTLANIGENGREAILPLDNNTGWMDKLAEKLNGFGNTGPIKLILNIDGKQLGWATIENINAITRQTGGLQLVLC